MDKIWDPIRAISVEATPEEKVRQMWILRMIGPLGYPKGLLSVEKEIEAGRRIDLMCYTPGDGGLKPLLLVECKAEEFFSLAEKQVWGYNAFVRAPFVCVICGRLAKTFWQEPSKICTVPFLPTYEQLLSSLRYG